MRQPVRPAGRKPGRKRPHSMTDSENLEDLVLRVSAADGLLPHLLQQARRRVKAVDARAAAAARSTHAATPATGQTQGGRTPWLTRRTSETGCCRRMFGTRGIPCSRQHLRLLLSDGQRASLFRLKVEGASGPLRLGIKPVSLTGSLALLAQILLSAALPYPVGPSTSALFRHEHPAAGGISTCGSPRGRLGARQVKALPESHIRVATSESLYPGRCIRVAVSARRRSLGRAGSQGRPSRRVG